MTHGKPVSCIIVTLLIYDVYHRHQDQDKGHTVVYFDSYVLLFRFNNTLALNYLVESRPLLV
jgi:hypothetical protein